MHDQTMSINYKPKTRSLWRSLFGL